MKTTPWIETRSGVRIDPFDARPDQIRITDIAFHLSNLARFNGAVEFYSVAQHSTLMSFLVPGGLALEALLHDATEAYLNDVSRPVKYDPRMEAYREAEAELEAVIRRAFGLPEKKPLSIKIWDERMFVTEAREFGLSCANDEKWADVESLEDLRGMDPWLPRDARAAFMARYKQITTPEVDR